MHAKYLITRKMIDDTHHDPKWATKQKYGQMPNASQSFGMSGMPAMGMGMPPSQLSSQNMGLDAASQMALYNTMGCVSSRMLVMRFEVCVMSTHACPSLVLQCCTHHLKASEIPDSPCLPPMDKKAPETCWLHRRLPLQHAAVRPQRHAADDAAEPAAAVADGPDAGDVRHASDAAERDGGHAAARRHGKHAWDDWHGRDGRRWHAPANGWPDGRRPEHARVRALPYA